MRLSLIEDGRDLELIQMISAKPVKWPGPFQREPEPAELGRLYAQGQVLFRCFEKPSAVPCQHQLRDERGIIEPISILSVVPEGKSFVVTAEYLAT
jgi:hypothetical protein